MGKTAAWIGAIFGSVGLVFAAVACWLYLADRSVAAGGVHTQGTVVEMVGSRDSDGSYSSRPVVEFVAADGTRHRFASSVSTSLAARRFTSGSTSWSMTTSKLETARKTKHAALQTRTGVLALRYCRTSSAAQRPAARKQRR